MNVWIQTYTGVAFNLLEPTPDMVKVSDIAHALSNLCRYTGHSERFYSVAEHSVEVAKLALDMGAPSPRLDVAALGAEVFGEPFAEQARRGLQKSALAMARLGLMHDAAEAYVGDVSSPLKSQLPEYKRIEKRIAKVVFERFGLVHDVLPYVIKHLDLVMLMSEAREMLGTPPRKWRIDVKPLEGWKPRFLSPEQARWEFLAMFDRLFGGRDG